MLKTIVSAAGEADPALAVAPRVEAATEVSPIMALFPEWEAAIARASLVQMEEDDREFNALMDAAYEIEKQMFALPSTSAADFAAKYIVATNYGEQVCGDEPLLTEAMALAGSRGKR